MSFPISPRFILAGFVIASLWVFASGTSASEVVLEEIPGVVAGGTRVQVIREDFQGTEGPLAMPDGSLIFTEPLANRINRISASNEVTPFLTETDGANALAYSPSGELLAVLIGKPALAVIFPADRAKVYARDFQGNAFFRPNDLVADKTGGIYFTDPSGLPKPGQPTPPKPSVYYFTPDGKLLLLTTAIPRPNGIQLSPDEKILYVANTSGEFVLAFDLRSPGQIGAPREFAKLAGFRQTETGTTSGADGLAIDASGRLYVATTVGVQVFSPTGQPLGILALPKPPQNLAFAGSEKKTLYVVGRGAVYRIAMLTAGFAGRAK